MSVRQRILDDLKAAMLARDETRLGALRLVKAEFLKAEKEKGQTLDAAREMSILQMMVKQRRDSITQFENAGRHDLAAKEQAELGIIEDYLPASLSEDEIKSHVDAVMENHSAAPDPKQAGKVMGELMARLKATQRPFDAKMANEMLRSRLAG